MRNELGLGKISGVMMLHYFKWPWCLEDLSNYVDDIHLLLHYSPSFKADWPRNCPKVNRIMEVTTGEEWQVMEWRVHQGEFRERLLRSLDERRPDLVFFPDEDEAFPEPELLVKDVRRLVRSRVGQLSFKRCNFWDSMETVRKDRWIYYGPHVKIYKWKEGLTYLPYGGFNTITSYGRRRLMSRSVMKHYAYMDKAEREWRYRDLYKAKQDTFKKLLSEPKLVRYTNARRAPRT